MKRALLLLALPHYAYAAEQPVELRPGAGLDAVQQNCGTCHSLDYIPMNSPFLTAKAWTAEVAKMRQVYGAPVADADATAIASYLAENYGPAAP